MSILKAGRPSKTEKAIAAVQSSQEQESMMNVSFPKTFYKKVKQYAINQDITIKELVFKALNEYMNK